VATPNVLIIRGGAIGDFILTLPAIRLVRESIPNARIEILGYKPIIDLAVAAGLADSTRHLEHAGMARLFAPNVPLEGGVADYFRSFNLVVSYLYDPDGIFRGNMERLGVKTFLEASHRVEEGRGHAAEQLARPLERLAMFLDDPAPRLHIADSSMADGRPTIVIHPGSGSLKKNWPVEHWVRLADGLGEKYPAYQLAVVTGEAEAERGITDILAKALAGRDYLHWDQLPLTELAARLSSAHAFIGHDSGISHLAAACGLPCLLFFGPTDPAVWAPRNAGVLVHAVPCGDLGSLDFSTGASVVETFLSNLSD
jgi:heptosyltransferase-3